MGEPISASAKQRLEDVAAYLVRNPRSVKTLVYLDCQQAVAHLEVGQPVTRTVGSPRSPAEGAT